MPQDGVPLVLPRRAEGENMTYREISRLDRTSIPEGREAEYAGLIKKYIVHKNKVVRALITACSVCVAALVLFAAIGRSAGLLSANPAVFWCVAGVLAAAAVGLAVAVGVNMARFQKFLKRFS